MDDETAKQILASLQSIQADTANLGARLDVLERGKQQTGPLSSKMVTGGVGGASGTTTEDSDNGGSNFFVRSSAKEKTLTLTFGEDESPTALRLFIEHYRLAKSQNMRKKIDGWDLPEFRANELRFQLRGQTASWILQENAMKSSWVEDDEEIIKHLEERFLGTQCIELNIMAFEDLKQNDGETLAAYMTRCQEKGFQAFADFEQNGVQQRIVWKFLSGIKDSDVRAQVIKEKWMETSSKAKSFAEVLKIAETAKLSKIATAATGGKGGRVEEHVKIAAVNSRVDDRRRASNKPHPNRSDKPKGRKPSYSSESNSSSKSDLSKSETPAGTNLLCHYCNERSHFGGWKFCEKRQKEDPTWTPNF